MHSDIPLLWRILAVIGFGVGLVLTIPCALLFCLKETVKSMFKRVRQWMLQRELSACIRNSPMQFGLAAGSIAMFGSDRFFYSMKRYMRERFPGAFIEIAEGVVTVIKDGVTAKVRV